MNETERFFYAWNLAILFDTKVEYFNFEINKIWYVYPTDYTTE